MWHFTLVEVKSMQWQQKQHKRIGQRWLALGLALGVVLAAPAAFCDVYAWRTEDGTYAYTDNRDHVPARYADQVKVISTGKLKDYARFTPQVKADGDRYAAALEKRLQYLRQVNDSAPAAIATPVAATAATAPGSMLSLSTGDSRAPQIEVPVGQGGAPIIVEPVNAKRTGEFRTRRVTVISQGGHTLAVIKSNPHTFNPMLDIHDEAALDQGAPLRDD